MKIILCMIVKNESRIIERVINSVSRIIDDFCICDTGSTDNTIEIIKKYTNNIYNHKWLNFGINRTMSFISCVETAKKSGFNLSETYALLLDADMELVINVDFNKNNLTETCYSIKQLNGNYNYFNIRLIRLDQDWKCIGVTHEFWQNYKSGVSRNNKNENSFIKLNSLFIKDHGDGGSKSDKFIRDIRLLSRGLIDEPHNSRYMFYLANSYRDNNQSDKAIEMYKKYIIFPTWDEEKWYSMLQIGILSKDKNKKFKWLLKAFEFRSSRSEPLYYLANYCQKNKLYNQGFMFAKMGNKIPFPENDILFIEYDVYKYKCLFEISVCAFYTDFKDEGYKACEDLIKIPDLPDDIFKLTISNILFYNPRKINLPRIVLSS